MSALALPPPYGLGSKCRHVSIQAPRREADTVARLVEDHGCPRFVADKVRACIHHSGRYDCLVVEGVSVDRLGQELLALGGMLYHLDMERDEDLHGRLTRLTIVGVLPSQSAEQYNPPYYPDTYASSTRRVHTVEGGFRLGDFDFKFKVLEPIYLSDLVRKREHA